jgi:hypothetical protein
VFEVFLRREAKEKFAVRNRKKTIVSGSVSANVNQMKNPFKKRFRELRRIGDMGTVVSCFFPRQAALFLSGAATPRSVKIP